MTPEWGSKSYPKRTVCTGFLVVCTAWSPFPRLKCTPWGQPQVPPRVCGLCIPVKWGQRSNPNCKFIKQGGCFELLSKSFVKYKTIVTDMFIAISWLSSHLFIWTWQPSRVGRVDSVFSLLLFLKTVLLRYNSLLGPLHRNRVDPPSAPSHPRFALDVETNDIVFTRRVWRG